MTPAPARPGPWLDCSTPLSDATLAAVLAWRDHDGSAVQGIVRTGPLPQNSPRADLSPGEASRIVAAGFQLSLYQHVRGPGGWMPSKHDGAADAERIAEHAAFCGLPAGVHIWQDLEDVKDTAEATQTHARAWGELLKSGAYQPALYVGFAVPLTGADLYALPHNRYARDLAPRAVGDRGVSWYQRRFDVEIGGVKFDVGTMGPDLKGDLPVVAQG